MLDQTRPEQQYYDCTEKFLKPSICLILKSDWLEGVRYMLYNPSAQAVVPALTLMMSLYVLMC